MKFAIKIPLEQLHCLVTISHFDSILACLKKRIIRAIINEEAGIHGGHEIDLVRNDVYLKHKEKHKTEWKAEADYLKGQETASTIEVQGKSYAVTLQYTNIYYRQ